MKHRSGLSRLFDQEERALVVSSLCIALIAVAAIFPTDLYAIGDDAGPEADSTKPVPVLADPSSSPVPPVGPDRFRCAPGNLVTIDFDETFGSSSKMTAGEYVRGQYSAQGVQISATSFSAPAASGIGANIIGPIIFDSSCGGSSNPADCSGGDPDLGSPNEIYGGPGRGVGGASNRTPLGNILIIPENTIDANSDGIVDEPDDSASGGIINFEFSSPVQVQSLQFLDVEVEAGLAEQIEVIGFKPNGDVAFAPPSSPALGDNSFAEIQMPYHGTVVKRLQLTFDDTSGSVAELKYCRQICVLDECGVCNGPGRDECGFCPVDEDEYGLGKDECGFCPGDTGYGVGKDDCELCPGDDLYGDAKDECGVCFGNNSTCVDCLSNPNGDAVIDECGECVSPLNVNQAKDDCGVCFGNNESKNVCGICGADDSVCFDDCQDTDISSDLFAFDGLAFDKFNVNKALIRAFRNLSGDKTAYGSALSRSEQAYQASWIDIWSQGSSVVVSCDNPTCVAVNSQSRFIDYTANSDLLTQIGRRIERRGKRMARRKGRVARKIRRLGRRRRNLARQDEVLKQEFPAEILIDCS
ncbi:hypothetical protein MRY87_07605 [bacterium]|nr:hypothetical protein [bacterium]